MKRVLHITCCVVLFFACSSILQAQTVTTVAGNGTNGFSGDGGSALGASFGVLGRIVVDTHGNLYALDADNNRVRKVSANGIVTTFAGGGTSDYTVNNVPATSADLGQPTSLAIDKSGNVYVGSLIAIRKIDTTGMITTIAGNGSSLPPIYTGLALGGCVNGVNDMAIDKYGNIFFLDNALSVVVKIDTLGMMSIAAGILLQSGPMSAFDSVSATSGFEFLGPQSICVDGNENLYIADLEHLWMVNPQGMVHSINAFSSGNSDTVAGGYFTVINNISYVATDKYDRVFFVADWLYQVNGDRSLSLPTGHINNCQGTYSLSAGESVFVDTATFNPRCIIFDTANNMYYVSGNYSIRKITEENQNKISGYIPYPCQPDGSVPSFKVSLLMYDTASSAMQCVDSAITTSVYDMQYYEFMNKPVGNYAIKAEPVGNAPINYVPTYSYNSVYWDSARYWHHNLCIDAQTYAAIQIAYNSAGTDTVSGNITSGENKGTDAAIPVSDMGVYLRDAAYTIVGYTHTNAAGDYTFTNVPDGSYDVYPETINYTTTPYSQFTVGGAQTSFENANFRQHIGARTITPYSTTNVPGVTGVSIQIYPNPATDKLTITGLSAADDVKLFDVNGKAVYTATISAQQSTFSFSVKALAPGSYMLQVRDRAGYSKYSKAVVKN